MGRTLGGGLEVRLGDLAFGVSAALDLVSPTVVGHHLRVARIARAIARELGFTREQMRDLLLAAALHDSGAFSLRERLDIMQFETRNPGQHSLAGYRLLKTFPRFEQAARIVRFHHLSWDFRRGEQSQGRPVPAASHLLHLADRVGVLPIDPGGSAQGGAAIAKLVGSESGSRFKPQFVEAFAAAAGRQGFWAEVSAAGDDDLRGDPAFGEAILSEADLRGLARLFWQIVDFRSPYTATHSSGVTAVIGFLAPLAGVAGAAGRQILIAASLHDLGKLAVPSETLNKMKPLTPAEFASLRNHPLSGWRILERIAGMEEINQWANYHHERLDGQGYPFRISAERLSLESRVVAVADVFTALTEERPYRRGMSGREATGILGVMAEGNGLDPDIVALVKSNCVEVAQIRRLAQAKAARSYLAFRGQAPGAPVRGDAAVMCQLVASSGTMTGIGEGANDGRH